MSVILGLYNLSCPRYWTDFNYNKMAVTYIK